MTNSDLLSLEGEAGNFKARLNQRPRYIDADKCTGCGLCTTYCPRHAEDDYNEGLAITRPIHIDYPQAVPATYYIDPDACLHLKHGTCQICVPVCRSRAIDFSQEEEEKELDIGAVVLSPGFGRVPEEALEKFGYGKHPDVLTSLEFERLLNPSGPAEGEVTCFSDNRHPRKIAFLQCVGSRDLGCDNGYCSSVCCMYAIKEAMVAKEHDPDCEITIFYIDMRTQGKDFDAARRRAEEEFGIKFVRARVADVTPWKNRLKLTYSTMSGSHHFESFDMVVLSVGLDSPAGAKDLARLTDIELNKYEFCRTDDFAPLNTSREGVYVAGAFKGPMDIPESVTQASATAGAISSLLKESRGKEYVVKTYPEEQEVSETEEPRIGVFVCSCGINIANTVDVEQVAEHAGGIENVVYCTNSMYSCSQDAQEMLKEKIKEHDLNKVVMAACSPRTHEPLFQETLKDAGLNRCLFEMVNIRDQCSWVHANEPEAATDKSKDLVRMGVAKADHITSLEEHKVPVHPGVLIIGGGIAGLTAAESLAGQGFKCTLVEKNSYLGGHLADMKWTLAGEDTDSAIKAITGRVKKNKNIEVYTSSQLQEITGFVGNFSSVVKTVSGKKETDHNIEHGVIVLATGGREYRPDLYMLGQTKKVVTQKELETRLAGKAKNRAPDSVVMIQCAGSRGEDLNYCSKVCCNNAVKNALKIKEINPDSQVIVLYRDMRTYGYAEDAYKEARDKGVVFVPYETSRRPVVAKKGNSIDVSWFDPILGEDVSLNPELIVLSVGMVPEETEDLSQKLKLSVNENKFFMEAHVKLQPVEMAVDGVYVCGLAHSPKPVDEIVAQAQAAAGKAASPLYQGEVTVPPIVSVIDKEKCIGCGICASLCPYNAIQMVKEGKKPKAETLAASCKGCGICASRCPTFAISMGGFTAEQIEAQIEAFGGKGQKTED